MGLPRNVLKQERQGSTPRSRQSLRFAADGLSVFHIETHITENKVRFSQQVVAGM